MPQKIEISHKTIVFTVVFLGLVWFLYVIREIIFQIFLALVIMSILNPPVTRLQRLKVPRAVSVLIVYVLVFVLLGFSIAQMAPILADQTARFATSINEFVRDAPLPGPITEQITGEIATLIGTIPSQLVKIGVSVFSNLIAVLTVLFLALYFLLARNKLDSHLGELIRDEAKQKKVVRILVKLERKLGGWARGQIVLMAIVGVATYIGLILLGIPFALPLALLAGILEIVPSIGPILATIPAILVGFSISPLSALAVGALSFLIQQLEIYFLVPKVMERSAGVSPVATLLSLVVGLKIAGVAGAVLAVPIVITVQILLEELVLSKNS